jgi:hypothetical protein
MSCTDPISPQSRSQPAQGAASGGGSNDFEKRLQALEKSDKSRWKQWGIILGVLGGLIAIPKGIHDAWESLFPAPSVQLSWRDDVAYTYDPAKNSVYIIYYLSISNAKGTAEDRIKSVSISLQARQQFLGIIGTPDIQFKTGNQSGTSFLPVTILKGESKDVQLYASLTPKFANAALPGTRETEVSFSLESKGIKKPLQKKFCLPEMDSTAWKDMLNGQPWHPRNTACRKT